MGSRSAAWSTACRRGCRSPKPTSSAGSTAAGPASRSSRPSAASRTRCRILSGTFEGLTTGAPISLVIDNVDARAKDYGAIKDQFRPGHADYTYLAKYGIRDYRGSGRASARETAMRVAAGAVARKVLGSGITIQGALIQIGADRIDRVGLGLERGRKKPVLVPGCRRAARWEALLLETRKNGSSLGAVIEVIASGVPVGLGEPVYDKLDADLAKAMMSINAVKGVEIGAGFLAAELSGEENADEMRIGNDGRPLFLSNQAGGILGGISTRPGRRGPLRGQADQLDPDAAGARSTASATRSRSRPRAATTPASASAPCRSARR